MVGVFRQDQKLSDILDQKKFTVSAEIVPPRNGSAQNDILGQISKLVSCGAQFLSVTKGAGGSLRGGSLPIAQAIKDHYQVPAIAHFTCRDLTPEEVENQLMDHHYFGIRNILALRGDPPQGVKDWKPNPLSYPYAFQLIEQIQKLNQGQFLDRQGYSLQEREKTNFCIGAAAYPDEPRKEFRSDHFKLKIQAGAEYGITQMIYDVESYSRFLHEISKLQCDVPILPGIRILKTQTQALKMRDRFQISMPDSYLKTLPADEAAANSDQALESFLALVENFKKAGAPGVHVFVLSDIELSCLAIGKLL